MKKLIMLLSALLLMGMLSGCSISELREKVTDRLDLTEAADWLFSLGNIKLDSVLTADEIRESLPQELACVTVEDTALDCEVTHLVIKERSTDTTRQTDNVICEVEVEGDGIHARYECDLTYTYTSNNGWGLVYWTIDQDDLSLNVTEGTLMNQLTTASLEKLEGEFGENSVSYDRSQWAESGLMCSVYFNVDAVNGYMLTKGSVCVNAQLEMDVEKGLYYSWESIEDTSGLTYGADLSNTVWLVSGNVDTDKAALALRIDDFDMDTRTVTMSAVAKVNYKYDLVTNTVSGQVVNWTNADDGTVTFTLTAGRNSWDLCFNADRQWARMNSNYVDLITQQDSSADLETLVESTGISESVSEGTINYDSKTTGYSYKIDVEVEKTDEDGETYTDTDEVTVYSLKISYPDFKGSDSYDIDDDIQRAVDSFLAKPTQSTSKDDLTDLYNYLKAQNRKVPLEDTLDISVEYDKNGYLSILYTYTYLDRDGNSTYKYDSVVYDLNTMKKLDVKDFLSGTDAEIGAVVNASLTNPQYKDEEVVSKAAAWGLTGNGVTFYVPDGKGGGHCDAGMVPFTDSLCKLNPNK